MQIYIDNCKENAILVNKMHFIKPKQTEDTRVENLSKYLSITPLISILHLAPFQIRDEVTKTIL